MKTKSSLSLALLPQPKSLKIAKGSFRIPASGTIGITDSTLFPAAEQSKSLFPHHSINIILPGITDSLSIRIAQGLKSGGYSLAINPDGITLDADSVSAAFHGLQTLNQISLQSRTGTLPCLQIEDWPDFADRGVYYDVCRGRVPKLEQLLQMVDQLAHYKINHFQLYVEHTFLFRGHPDIGKDVSPLTAEDILTLDRHCRDLHIELVPSLASFGHLATVLKHPQYHALAETAAHHSLSPANPKSYTFLDSLFAEFLPLFSSKRFNVCCDEVMDLGNGQSSALCKKKGKGEVYLGHIVKLNQLARKYGKQIMFWGDIIRHYPALINQIPKDVTVLDWGYNYNHMFETIEDFKNAGLPFFACPGTSSWCALFPRLPEAMANIAGFAAAGKKFGAQGFLNTDWGDGGHYNFMEYSWHGYLFGAEQAWNTQANQKDFTDRFTRLFLHSDRQELATALTALGDVTHLSFKGIYQSIWQTLFFAPANDPIFQKTTPLFAAQSRNNCITEGPLRLDAKLGRQTLERLVKIRKTFATRHPGEDPIGVLPYWVFAVDTITHAARKLTVLAPGGSNTPAARKALAHEMTALQVRFEKLWHARNRQSELNTTLTRYAQAIRTLTHYTPPLIEANPTPWRGPFLTTWQVSKVIPRKRGVAHAPAVSQTTPLQWRKFKGGMSATGPSFTDVHDLFKDQDGLVYLSTRLQVKTTEAWTLQIGHDGGVRAFVDGKAVLCEPRPENPAQPYRTKADIDLSAGSHELVIAFDLNHGFGWGVYACFEVPEAQRKTRRKPCFPRAI